LNVTNAQLFGTRIDLDDFDYSNYNGKLFPNNKHKKLAVKQITTLVINGKKTIKY
jgi:hypothetical protein